MWREKFADALQDFRLRKFDSAERGFRQTIALRKAAEQGMPGSGNSLDCDGPSLFYLERIAEFRVNPPPYAWIGEVELKGK